MATTAQQMTALTDQIAALETRIRRLESIAAAPRAVSPLAPDAASGLPAGKTVALHVETQRGDGTLTFVRVETLPSTWEVEFYYETGVARAYLPDIHQTVLYGKSGKAYTTHTFGESEARSGKGHIRFQGVTDFSDLSAVTLTYAFREFEPVTVSFDIPDV